MTVYCRAPIGYATGAESPFLVETDIHDARAADAPGCWRENGFELLEHRSAVSDWSDEAAIAAVHFDEISALARELTACDTVLFYPIVLRDPERAASHEDFAPIQVAHSDYTESYRAIIGDDAHPYHALLEPSMRRAGVSARDIQAAARVTTLQFWRNVGPPLVDYPLAFADARSVPREALSEIIVESYGGLETGFDAFIVAPPGPDAAYRWYTYPALEKHEVVLFRAYDSEAAERGEAFWTPHVAFRDPHAGAAPAARRSIEMRAICLTLS